MADAMETFDISSYIRGYHAYQNVWTPVNGETLACVPEPYGSNSKDPYAVGIIRDGETVGHIPINNSKISWFFVNKKGGSILV